MAVFFLQQEHQQRAAVNLLRARGRGVHDRPLDNAVEADRRFGLDGFFAGNRRERLAQDLVKVAAQLRQIDTAAAEQLTGLRILDERVQEVFEADEIMAAISGQPERPPDAFKGLGGKGNGGTTHARCSSGSGSIVTSSGYSCCSAMRRVALTLVSATSRV